jgi:hypothetical protein
VVAKGLLYPAQKNFAKRERDSSDERVVNVKYFVGKRRTNRFFFGCILARWECLDVAEIIGKQKANIKRGR